MIFAKWRGFGIFGRRAPLAGSNKESNQIYKVKRSLQCCTTLFLSRTRKAYFNFYVIAGLLNNVLSSWGFFCDFLVTFFSNMSVVARHFPPFLQTCLEHLGLDVEVFKGSPSVAAPVGYYLFVWFFFRNGSTLSAAAFSSDLYVKVF